MNILFVITKSDMGGAQVFVLNLARALKQHGHNVEVVAGDGDFLFGELEKINVKYYYLDSLKRDINVFNAMFFMAELRRLLKRRNYDIIHLNSTNTLIGAVSAAYLKKNPKTVFTFHGLSFIDKNFSSNALIKLLAVFYYKIFLKFVDKIIFECNLNYDEVKTMKMVKSAKVIYNGLDESTLHFLTSEDARKYLSGLCSFDLSNSFIIGSTGRLTYQKNYEFLINVFPKIKEALPNAKAVIIGEGQDRAKYQDEIRRLGLENDFFLVGELKNSHRYIRGFDVFTMTSRYEGVSISLIEALFSKVPMLVSDVGGNNEVVGGDKNQLFELDNEIDYLNKLREIQNNKTSIMKNNTVMKAEFSLENMVSNYIKLFES